MTQASEGKPLRVLFSGDDLLGRTILDHLKTFYNGTYNVEGFWEGIHEAREIVDLAETQDVDVFVLILNNLIFQSGNQPAENRIEKILQFVTYIRETHERPVIGLFGWPDDPTFPQRARDAGANFVLRMPFDFEPFVRAFENCLTMVPRFEGAKTDHRRNSGGDTTKVPPGGSDHLRLVRPPRKKGHRNKRLKGDDGQKPGEGDGGTLKHDIDPTEKLFNYIALLEETNNQLTATLKKCHRLIKEFTVDVPDPGGWNEMLNDLQRVIEVAERVSGEKKIH